MNATELQGLGKILHERYQLAARIARATWPAAETSPEAMVAATATVFIAMNQNAPIGQGSPGGGGEQPPACPVCQGGMRDQRPNKRGNQPDFKCINRACDGAIWLDRKRRNGSHP